MHGKSLLDYLAVVVVFPTLLAFADTVLFFFCTAFYLT
jgi:hypothetical protein